MVDRDRRRITDPEVLKGLTHPLRRRAFRLLAQFGPASVTMLARRTDADPGRMSYHLRELARRGFIEPAPELARDGRESWWRLVPGSVSWSSTDLADPADRAVADALHDATVTDEFERLRAFEAALESWGREWAGAAETLNSHVRATPQELRELTAQFDEVIQQFRESPGRNANDLIGSLPDDGRESVFIFMHAFPERP